jgi:superfamily I DNA and RNA helicase
MSLLGKIFNFFKKEVFRVNEKAQKVQSQDDGLETVFEKVKEIIQRYSEFQRIFNTDWQRQSDQDKEEVIRDTKRLVVEVLIPAAGGISMMGVPGILVYTPCQIAGALAIAHVYRPDLTLTLESAKSVLGVMLWGKAGQFVWITAVEKIATSFPLPGLGIVVIPFVSWWTNIALDTVQKYYRNRQGESSFSQNENQQSSTPERRHEDVNNSNKSKEKQNSESDQIQDVSDNFKKASDLLEHIDKGGKILFPMQEKVFQELIDSTNNISALNFGKTHFFRGVAGSGKTIMLAQLIPHLVSSFQEGYGRYPLILVYHHNTYIRQLLRKEIQSALDAPINLQPLPTKIYTQNIHVHTLTTLINFLDNRDVFVSKPKSTQNGSETAQTAYSMLRKLDGEFDIILVDEGQDLEENQFKLLTALCRNNGQMESKNLYVFYDDLQNIFRHEGTLIERFKSDEVVEHFLSRCIRTSKKIVDFTFNTCLGSSIDKSFRAKLEQVMNIDHLKQLNLISNRYTEDGYNWLDCQFCLFPGQMKPQVYQFPSEEKCFETLQNELEVFLSEEEIRHNFKSGILIICFTNELATRLHKKLERKFGEDIQLRSGANITSNDKLRTLVVEAARINIANIWDAKGYDADIVYILNPDEGGGTPYDHRVRFYVAATRSKQFLGVYNFLPEDRSPIVFDAFQAVKNL